MSESLSAEAICEIERLVLAGKRTEFVRGPGEPEGTYYALNPDGTRDHLTADAKPWNATFSSLQSLAWFVNAKDLSPDEGASIFVSPEGVVACLDNASRRNFARLPLTHSTPWKWLAGTIPLLAQKDFVRLLRITFDRCLPSNVLIGLVRQVKWSSSAEADGDIKHGRESLGRSVQASVTGVDAFPEEIPLSVQVFEQFPFRVTIRCALELFPQEQVFKLSPFPGQLQLGLDAALESIRKEADELLPEVPVYLGKM